MPTTPTDPLYASQWHFALMGDIETIWDEYTGAGVHVGVYDDGIEYAHQDLDGNYDASRHVLDNFGVVVDGNPEGNAPHGTSVAGLIAAEAFNGEGGVGVAWGAGITGVNIFGPSTYGYVNAANDSGFLDVVHQAAELFDISSNSWGSTPVFSPYYQSLADPISDAARLDEEYAYLSEEGRDGLGTIINQAAGNDTLEANGSGVNASRYTNTIGATDASGDLTYYSNFGASVLVVAPAGAVTTDRLGTPGYNEDGGATISDYTDGFGGTSAATPIVSGVTALMLEANPTLGWRDVQDILAVSASYTGTMDGSGIYEVDSWSTNNGTSVNAGGQHINGSYGYGMVNAYNSVRNAEVWSLFGEADTSANEMVVQSDRANMGGAYVPDGSSSGYVYTLEITEDLEIDSAMLYLNTLSYDIHDLRIIVTSPDGTETVVKYEDMTGAYSQTHFGGTWAYGIENLRGEGAMGTWTVEVQDLTGGNASYLVTSMLEVYGSAPSDDEVHHFNDEFLAMAGADPSRLLLEDTNGGEDWLNFAPVSGDVSLDLATSGTGTTVVDGAVWFSIDTGSQIEHAVTGDGNDTLEGNFADNMLFGMRGDDVLLGESGNDTLDGGTGNDTLEGGDDDDALSGGVGLDWLLGGDGNDTLSGGEDNDTLEGGFGADTLAGDAGDDSLSGGGFGDEIDGGDGDDTLRGEDGPDTLLGGAGHDSILGGGNTDSIEGGTGRDTISGNLGNDTLDGGGAADSITGGDGRDLILGDQGNDTLVGNKADDTIIGGQGSDSILGGDDNDSLIGNEGYDTILGGSGDDYIEGNSYDDDLMGQSGNDTIWGGAGDDYLDGGGDADELRGGSGQNTLVGNNGDDVMYGGGDEDLFVFWDDFGADTVHSFTAGEDLIEMQGYTAGDLTLTNVGGDTLVEVAGIAETILIDGVVLSDFSDFLFT